MNSRRDLKSSGKIDASGLASPDSSANHDEDEQEFMARMLYVNKNITLNRRGSGASRRRSRQTAVEEWITENEARELYDVSAPPPLLVKTTTTKTMTVQPTKKAPVEECDEFYRGSIR